MEEGPSPGLEPIQAWWSWHVAGRPNAYYLRYFGREAPGEWPVVLPRGAGARHGETPAFDGKEPAHAYRADIIDSWNMTITPVEGLFRMTGRSEYELHDPERPAIRLPARPWLAVRLVRA
jgi:hypothetical protein